MHWTLLEFGTNIQLLRITFQSSHKAFRHEDILKIFQSQALWKAVETLTIHKSDEEIPLDEIFCPNLLKRSLAADEDISTRK